MNSVVDPVANALAEDLGTGDLTGQFFVDPSHQSTARIFAKQSAVVAGVETAEAVFRQVDPSLAVLIERPDGSLVQPNETVLRVKGTTRSILSGERVALNFLQRLSGIATLTRQFVQRIEGTNTRVLDTRKTTPGLRALEKSAVKAGGGTNHRMGLYDFLMVKDNHLLTHPDLQSAIDRVRANYPDIRIEVEADSVEQVRQFVRLRGIDYILLDNMSPDELRQCVAIRPAHLEFEASGGVNLSTIRAIADTGVDFVSVGQLTHSAVAVDYSLEVLDD